MGLARVIQVALRSLLAHKLRTTLTLLGVVIGVACVIAMVSIGEGARRGVTSQLEGLGSNLLFVWPMQASKGHRMGGTSVQTLTLEDAAAILRECRGVRRLAPESGGVSQVKYFAKNVNTTVQGTTPEFAEVRNHKTASGQFFSEDDVRFERRVCVLGFDVARDLFGEGTPLGESVKIQGSNFRVVGVLEQKGSSGMMNPDTRVYVPITTAMKRLFGKTYLSSLNVEAAGVETMERAQAEMEEVLRRRHRIEPGAESDFTIRSQKEMIQTFAGVAQTFTALLAGVAAVSLLVGGIGIMNIMLVSVTERTKEIGIRKALGATKGDILQQFLIEAVVVSAIGGGMGIAIGWSLVQFGVRAALPDAAVPVWAVGVAFLFSGAVGVVFGIFPAAQAASLDPIEALRYE